jgi:hypothetical protein
VRIWLARTILPPDTVRRLSARLLLLLLLPAQSLQERFIVNAMAVFLSPVRNQINRDRRIRNIRGIPQRRSTVEECYRRIDGGYSNRCHDKRCD